MSCRDVRVGRRGVGPSESKSTGQCCGDFRPGDIPVRLERPVRIADEERLVIYRGRRRRHNGWRYNRWRHNGWRYNGWRHNGWRHNGWRYNGWRYNRWRRSDCPLCVEYRVGCDGKGISRCVRCAGSIGSCVPAAEGVARIGHGPLIQDDDGGSSNIRTVGVSLCAGSAIGVIGDGVGSWRRSDDVVGEGDRGRLSCGQFNGGNPRGQVERGSTDNTVEGVSLSRCLRHSVGTRENTTEDLRVEVGGISISIINQTEGRCIHVGPDRCIQTARGREAEVLRSVRDGILNDGDGPGWSRSRGDDVVGEGGSAGPVEGNDHVLRWITGSNPASRQSALGHGVRPGDDIDE